MAKRIQRKRTKGWRMPEGAVYVGRPTEWGNEFTRNDWPDAPLWEPREREGQRLFRAWATAKFKRSLKASPGTRAYIRSKLRGKDLVCWCPLPADGEPDHCHAAVLLEIANANT